MKVAEAGGIDVVVSAMKRNEGHAGVQEAGCRALQNLTDNAENKVEAACQSCPANPEV